VRKRQIKKDDKRAGIYAPSFYKWVQRTCRRIHQGAGIQWRRRESAYLVDTSGGRLKSPVPMYHAPAYHRYETAMGGE
jgi:hypothetical protein